MCESNPMGIHPYNIESYNASFSMNELENVLVHWKSKTAGPDSIDNVMLKNLSPMKESYDY